MNRNLVVAFSLLTFGSLVSAQSLVDVARKEKERRKKVEAQENHTFSERDLKSSGLRTAPQASSAKQAEAAAQSDTGASETQTEASSSAAAAQEDPTKTQAYWHDKVSAIDKKIQDLETRLNSPQMTSNARGASEREKVERDLAQARRDRDALADEARRKGVPPGWLR